MRGKDQRDIALVKPDGKKSDKYLKLRLFHKIIGDDVRLESYYFLVRLSTYVYTIPRIVKII